MQRKENLLNAPSQDERFLQELNAKIEETLSDPDNEPEFSIDTICKKLYIGRSTLFRKIEEITGETPNNYIKNYRLERASQLLEQDKGNVTEVAGAVGFDNPQYFARCFREKFNQSPKKYQKIHLKTAQGKSGIGETTDVSNVPPGPQVEIKLEFTIKELDRELLYRLPLPKPEKLFDTRLETPQRHRVYDSIKNLYESLLSQPANEAGKNIPTTALIEKIQKALAEWKEVSSRSGRYAANPLDFFAITEKPIIKNAQATAAVCMKTDLITSGTDYSRLRVGKFGEIFNLSPNEPFLNQPIGTGPLSSGVLVAEDIIATVAHFANEKNVADLCFVFDFIMKNPDTPITEIPPENFYTGTEILHRVHNPSGDWALVKLDRKVKNREPVASSNRKIFYEQPVYIIGHPCGLPLKFSPGGVAIGITDDDFRVNLGIYSSNSGSPVFCAQTHELLGIVSRAKPVDLRWTGNGWISLPYLGNSLVLPGSQCTRATKFFQFIETI